MTKAEALALFDDFAKEKGGREGYDACEPDPGLVADARAWIEKTWELLTPREIDIHVIGAAVFRYRGPESEVTLLTVGGGSVALIKPGSRTIEYRLSDSAMAVQRIKSQLGVKEETLP